MFQNLLRLISVFSKTRCSFCRCKLEYRSLVNEILLCIQPKSKIMNYSPEDRSSCTITSYSVIDTMVCSHLKHFQGSCERANFVCLGGEDETGALGGVLALLDVVAAVHQSGLSHEKNRRVSLSIHQSVLSLPPVASRLDHEHIIKRASCLIYRVRGKCPLSLTIQRGSSDIRKH